MQTFSVAVGEYAGFGFRVNPVDTSIVEFHYLDGDTRVIAQFNRNGVLRGEHREPANTYQGVKRDVTTGKPLSPVEPTEQELEADRVKAAEADPRVAPYAKKPQPPVAPPA